MQGNPTIKKFLGLLIVLFLGAGIRVIKLDADAPTHFPNRFHSSAPVKDESAKGYEARNKTLFKTFNLSPKDQYRYWRTLSPVWVYSLWVWFEIFGVSYITIRLFSILWWAISGLLLWLLLCRRFSSSAGFGALWFFSFNYYQLIFSRLGLIETMLNCLLIFSVFLLLWDEKKSWLLVIAPVFWVLAYFTKQSALFILPLFFVYQFWLLKDKEVKIKIKICALLSLLACVFVVVLMCFDPDYRIRSILNLRHVLDYKPDPSYLWLKVAPETTLASFRWGLSFRGLWEGYFMMLEIASAFAVMELGYFLWLGLVRKIWSRDEAILVLWLVMARAVLLFSPHHYVRFYLIQFPPSFLLAGIFFSRWYNFSKWQAGSVLLLSFLLNFFPWFYWLQFSEPTLRESGKMLEQLLGKRDAVIIGEWAGPVVFDTSYKSVYVKSVFNRSKEQLCEFGITHILTADDEEDPALISYKRFFPSAWEKRKELGVISVLGFRLWLYEVETPCF